MMRGDGDGSDTQDVRESGSAQEPPPSDAPEDSDFGDSLLSRFLGTLPFRLPQPGEKLGGRDGLRFEIVERLGGGAMGVVFSAYDAELRRKVALKSLLPREGLDEEMRLGLLLQEARAIAKLGHENIVRIFDVAEWAGDPNQGPVPFLVMEYLDGEPLNVLMRRERLEWHQVLALLSDIAAGLAHAHEQHVIHRDLKPGNVFVTREGVAKLLDFGLAHLMEPSVDLDPALSMAGTPIYKAPEQWWGGTQQDERTDIWAVGVLLYEMLAGQHPYLGIRTHDELRARVLSDEPMPSIREDRADLPVEVEALLASMLAKSPERRMSSAVELRDQLRELEDRLGPWREHARTAVAQRRQVTLVSCLLTGVSSQLDTEDVDELEAAFHEVCLVLFPRHGGAVLLAAGKRVLACFGYPTASEHASECAVRAGQVLTRTLGDAVRRRLPLLPHVKLAVQVGVHTDTVTLDERAPTSRGGAPSLHGEAPEIATWLARQAGPNHVLLSGTTSSLVSGAFRLERLGSRDFEGLSETRALAVYRLERERKAGSRFARAHLASALTPMVGRSRELGELLAAWDGVRQGRGTFFLVRGEAGIGKSRLLQALHQQVSPATYFRLRCQCWAQFRHSAYQPVIEMFQHLLRLSPERTPQHNLGRLRKYLARFSLGPEQVLLIASFLSLPVADASGWLQQLSPEHRKELTHEALMTLLLRLARERPVLVIVEDVHWADPSTLQLLGIVLEHLGAARLGVFLSTRPDFQPAWPRRAASHVLTLERLSAQETATLVRDAAGTDLAEETVAQLVARTDGIPLFAEEMTRTVVGQGGSGPHPLTIPVALNELLLTRLDQLPRRQKELAWLCAVVGRSFTQALLAPLTGQGEAALRRDLRILMGVGLVRPLEDTAEPTYQFRHALIQEAAYHSLPRGTRRQHHARIARVLAEHFPQVAEAQPEVLAHHATEAGDVEAAIGHWGRAGWLACHRSAGVEAVSHLDRALCLLRSLPEASRRIEEELRLLMVLGFALLQVEGCSERLEQTYARARELIFAVGEELPRLDLSYWGIYSYNFMRGRFLEAHEFAEHLVDLGERQANRELLALGLRLMATDLFNFGDFPASLAHIQHALACSDFTLEEHRALAVKHWNDPRAAVLAYASVVYSVVAQPEQARASAQDAVRLADRIGHPHTRAFVLTYVALGCLLRQELGAALECIAASEALSREHHFRIWLGWSRFLRSWALSERGEPAEGLQLLDETLEQWERSGFRSGMPLYLGLRAEMLLKLGRPGEALRAIARALGWAHETCERSYLAELHRLEGEGHRALGGEARASQCFLQAMSVARQQGAITFLRRAEACLYRDGEVFKGGHVS